MASHPLVVWEDKSWCYRNVAAWLREPFIDASLKVTFVDAKSGDVLAYTFLYNNNGKFEQDPEAAYGKRLGKEFQRIGVGPKPGPGSAGK